MALFVKRYIYKDYGTIPEGASRFYIAISSEYLSEAYELVDGDEILGYIERLKKGADEFPEFRNKEIKLILQRREIIDILFISKNDWNKHFRDWGIVKSGYEITLRLTKAIKKDTGKEIHLYPKRSVKA